MTRGQVLTTRSGRVKAARRLHRRAVREDEGRFLAEGVKALYEAVERPDTVIEVFATVSASHEHATLRRTVERGGAAWHLVDEVAMGMLAGTVTPQGVVSVCRSVLRPVADVVAAAAGRMLVICDDVRDPGNAGTIIRTADAVGAGGVVLAGQSVDPHNDKTVRATVGSLFHQPIGVDPDTAAVVAAVRAAGYRVLAAERSGETDLFAAMAQRTVGGPVAWVFGNEAHGLPPGISDLADHRVSIPIFGAAESLNLSVAAAVCLYATAWTQRRSDG